MGRLINLTETARRLGVTTQTLRNWTANGHIKVKSVGTSRFVDESTIMALQDTAADTARAVERLEEERAYCQNEAREIHNAREDDRVTRRYLNLCVTGSMRSEFFKIVLRLLCVTDCINEREADALTMRLNDVPLEDIGAKYGLTRERIRQITEKAMRKSKDLAGLEKRLYDMYAIEEENKVLKATVAELSRKLLAYEKPFIEGETQELERLHGLFEKKVKDCQFSTRTKNGLKNGYGNDGCVDTIGDLCRLTVRDVMKRRFMGAKCIHEISDFFKANGLSFEMDVDGIYSRYAYRQLQLTELKSADL